MKRKMTTAVCACGDLVGEHESVRGTKCTKCDCPGLHPPYTTVEVG